MGKIPYMVESHKLAFLEPDSPIGQFAVIFVQTDTLLEAMQRCNPEKFVHPESLDKIRDVARLQLNVDHNVPIDPPEGYVYKNEDGKLEVYLHNGRHRTAFAKLIGEEEVPVWGQRAYSETAVEDGLARFATAAEINKMHEAGIDPEMLDRAANMPGVRRGKEPGTWEIG